MGRDELTHDGANTGLAMPPRADGQPRYGDRFRRPAATLGDGPSGSDTVDLGVEAPPRTWPTWLTRGAAGLGVVATAVVAVSLGDDDDVPRAAPDVVPARSAPLNDPPAVAPLDVSRIEAELWDTSGFSYEVTLTNSTDLAYDVLDVGPAMSGTELAWDRTLVFRPGTDTTIRIDFLVLNCLAATTSAAPAEVRLVVREQGVDPVTALAQVPTVDEAAYIDAAGKAICARGGSSGDSVTGSP